MSNPVQQVTRTVSSLRAKFKIKFTKKQNGSRNFRDVNVNFLARCDRSVLKYSVEEIRYSYVGSLNAIEIIPSCNYA